VNPTQAGRHQQTIIINIIIVIATAVYTYNLLLTGIAA